MNKAKKIYIAKNEVPRYITRSSTKRLGYKEIDACDFEDTLYLKDICWQHSGSYFVLEDENGYTFYMSDVKFKEMIRQKRVGFQGKFGFFKQGPIQSIGFVE